MEQLISIVVIALGIYGYLRYRSIIAAERTEQATAKRVKLEQQVTQAGNEADAAVDQFKQKQAELAEMRRKYEASSNNNAPSSTPKS